MLYSTLAREWGSRGPGAVTQRQLESYVRSGRLAGVLEEVHGAPTAKQIAAAFAILMPTRGGRPSKNSRTPERVLAHDVTASGGMWLRVVQPGGAQARAVLHAATADSQQAPGNAPPTLVPLPHAQLAGSAQAPVDAAGAAQMPVVAAQPPAQAVQQPKQEAHQAPANLSGNRAGTAPQAEADSDNEPDSECELVAHVMGPEQFDVRSDSDSD